MRFDTDQAAHRALSSTTATVRAYAGSELSGHVIELLDALAISYCMDLVHVEPDGLVRLQSALRQVSMLRDVFANNGMDIPKI